MPLRARTRAEHNTFPSGVNREMAFDYQGFVTELAVVAAAEAELGRSTTSPNSGRSLMRMFDVVAATVDVQCSALRAKEMETTGRRSSSMLRTTNGGRASSPLGAALFEAPEWWPTVRAHDDRARSWRRWPVATLPRTPTVVRATTPMPA